jgi:putative ABC transport system permease protein
MNTLSLTYAYLKHNRLRTFYNVLMFATGTALIAMVLTLGNQLQTNLSRNLQGIDMVVGAKGSPLQLVLSAVLHADIPTGNIPLEEAQKLQQNPMVKQAIPVALGDNINGYRIVGTTPAYPAHYHAQLAAGRMFATKPLEAVLGSETAQSLHLHVGQRFVGSHGLTPGGEQHTFAPYTVVGVLKPTNTIVDRLALTPVESVWYVHENDDDEPIETRPSPLHREVTAMLVEFSTPLAIASLPRAINKLTNMQAASPAMEAFRLRQIMGIGSDTLKLLGVVMITLSGLGLLISMAEAVRQRLYDLALMRCFGASPTRIISQVALEGLVVSALGGAFGVALATFGTRFAAGHLFGGQLSQTTGLQLSLILGLLGGVIIIGLVGSLLPGLRVYRLSIPNLLASK